MPHQDPLDPKDHPDPLENPAQMDQLETLVFLLRANHFNLATQAQLEMQAHKDHLDHLVSPAKTDNPDLLDQRDQKDQKDHLEPMDSQDHKDPLGLQGHKESGVFVQNIALWTAVSSSRMEQDVKFKNLDFHCAHSIGLLFETASSFVYNFYNHPWLFCFYYYYYYYYYVGKSVS
jgi:hypothetical protein